MAKSSRASSRKVNNQRLKQKVFGPVETARMERLSSKLIELASQPKPQQEGEAVAMEGVESQGEESASRNGTGSSRTSKADARATSVMEVDSRTASSDKAQPSTSRGKRIEKRGRRKPNIVFPSMLRKKQLAKARVAKR